MYSINKDLFQPNLKINLCWKKLNLYKEFLKYLKNKTIDNI